MPIAISDDLKRSADGFAARLLASPTWEETQPFVRPLESVELRAVALSVSEQLGTSLPAIAFSASDDDVRRWLEIAWHRDPRRQLVSVRLVFGPNGASMALVERLRAVVTEAVAEVLATKGYEVRVHWDGASVLVVEQVPHA